MLAIFEPISERNSKKSMYGEDKFTDKLKFRIWQIITDLGW